MLLTKEDLKDKKIQKAILILLGNAMETDYPSVIRFSVGFKVRKLEVNYT